MLQLRNEMIMIIMMNFSLLRQSVVHNYYISQGQQIIHTSTYATTVCIGRRATRYIVKVPCGRNPEIMCSCCCINNCIKPPYDAAV